MITFIYMKYLEQANSYREKVDQRLPGAGKYWALLLNGYRVLFEVMEIFGNTGDGCTTL